MHLNPRLVSTFTGGASLANPSLSLVQTPTLTPLPIARPHSFLFSVGASVFLLPPTYF